VLRDTVIALKSPLMHNAGFDDDVDNVNCFVVGGAAYMAVRERRRREALAARADYETAR
jgi:hypothetical protein